MKALSLATVAVAVAVVLLTPSQAQAQVGGYVITSSSAVYTPLTGATPITFTGGGSTLADEGYETLPLGFTFTYFGATYTHIGVDTNGLIFLTNGAASTPCNTGSTSSTCYGNTVLPTSGPGPLSATSMKNFVAAWWDDLEEPTPGAARYKSTANEMAVEYSNWNYFFGTSTFSFIIRFKNSGAGPMNDELQLQYGSHVGTGGNATVGLQDMGSQAIYLLSGATAPCTNSCSATTWPTNTLITIKVPPPAGSELVVDSVGVTSFSVTSGTASVDFNAVVRNIGLTAANNWHYKVYLSPDRVLDASDLLAFNSAVSGTPTSVGADTTVTVSGTGTVANLAVGNYYVLVDVDTTNVVTELDDTNNNASTPLPYTVGIDLLVTSMSSGPADAGPGDTLSFVANVANTGSVDAGSVPYAVVMSINKSFTTSTYVAHTGAVALSNGQSATLNVSFPLPQNVAGGPQFFGLVLDPSNSISEASETNNIAWSATSSNIRQADLDLVSVDLLDPLTGQPSRTSYMGELRRVTATVKNIGQATAVGFNFGAILSRDTTQVLAPVGTDYNFQDVPATRPGGYTLAAGATATYTFDVTMPSTDRLVNGQPLPTGDYYIFIETDSFNDVTELKEDNNSRIIHYPGVNGGSPGSAIRLFTQAPDVAVSKVQVPSASAVGEVVPVYRALRNVGVQNSPAVPYRYYASANDLITEDDFPLEIIKADGTTTLTLDVTIPSNDVNVGTDFVRLPAGMPAGIYYIGAIIDPQNTIIELDEVNNSLASNATISVAAPAMRITSTIVPDAIVDRPFVFQLAATGTGGSAIWAASNLPPGLSVEPASGIIRGTPTVADIYAFDVTATAGGRSAASRLVVRVMPNSTELSITTLNLPPIVNSPLIEYAASLSAAGGQKPYSWKLVSGTLPLGVTVRAEGAQAGLVTGRPASGTAIGESRATFEVTDGVGNRARGSVRVRIIAPGAIMIKANSLQLPNGMVNVDYPFDLIAEAAGGTSALAPPLNWTVSGGNFPDGLTLSTAGMPAVRGIIGGRPTTPGTYFFSLQVEDMLGRTDSADYVVRIFETHFKVAAANVPTSMHPGDDVTFNLSSGSGFAVEYAIYSGRLPPGLELSKDGTVTGIIDSDPEKSVGSYNLVVTGKDKNGATGMGAVFVEVTRRPAEQGCSVASASGKPSFGALVLLFAAGMLFFRRSRKLAALAGLVAVAVLPTVASAQTNYTVMGPTNAIFQPMGSAPGPTPTAITVGSTVNPTPFPIKFFGTNETCVGVSAHGYLTMGCNGSLTSTGNTAIPHNSTFAPRRAVFAWWDATTVGMGSSIIHKTLGTAPNREFVVEWKDVYIGTATASRFSYQIHFYEGSSRIKLAYGGTPPSSATASVGIMGATGQGFPGMSCTPSCGTPAFPTNREIEFALPGDLAIKQLSGDDTAYANVAYRSTVTLANVGGSPVFGQKVRFYLSTNGSIDTSDVVLGDTVPVDLAPNTSKNVSSQGIVPPGTAEGSYFLLAMADPDNTFAEANELDNVGTPFPVTVGPPTPDLYPIQVATATSAAVPGQTLTVNRQIWNGGNAAITGAVKYTYFLSDNAVASFSDFPFPSSPSFTGLAIGGNNLAPDDTLTLPNDLPAGRYWLGLCVDYDPNASPSSNVVEISEVNNCLTSSTPFIVSSGQLAVITTQLPAATQHSPYSARLDAAGGNGTYLWSLTGGALPPGMRLTSDGFVAGSPAAAGSYSLEVQVQSGTATRTATLTLSVGGQGIPLAVVDQDLPTAEFGKAYLSSLIAIGGKPPYIWTLKAESNLPAGINVATDGTVEGRSSIVGEFMLSVEVLDSAGVRAAREVKLSVANPTQLAIKTQRLATAYVGKQYNMPLEAAGGAGGNTWKLTRLQQLAQGPTELPDRAFTPDNADPSYRLEGGAFPPQMGLLFYADPARPNSVALDGVPTRAGLFAVTLAVTDRNGVTDVTTLTLLVSYDQALAITTTALPDAFVGRPYRSAINHNAAGDLGVTFEQACVQQVASDTVGRDLPSFSCASADAQQQLPPGLSMGADGSIIGSATAPATFDGKTPQVFSFLVKARDPQGRYDIRSLSIKLRPNYEDAGGCSSVGGAAPMLMAALGALALLRRRRRSARAT